MLKMFILVRVESWQVDIGGTSCIEGDKEPSFDIYLM